MGKFKITFNVFFPSNYFKKNVNVFITEDIITILLGY